MQAQQLKASLKEIDDLKAALDEHAIVAICEPNMLMGGWHHSALMQNHNLCEAVKVIPPGAAHRHWTLRADNHGHHHGRVSISECPLYLELDWRRSVDDSVRRVGIFRLDLTGLLRDRYIRPEPVDSRATAVRLRIFRADDGSFYVQTNRHGPRFLLTGSVA